jgi:hypothetical protein
MKKMILGMVLSALAVSALAGFVDERQPVKAVHGPMASMPGAMPGSGAVGAFAVLPSDKSVRETLTRWAGSAGWMHLPEHWAVAEDYSVGGVAGGEVFGTDFKGAVRVLISSTDLTTRPAQPCFYSNNVVRVIPRTGICDPTAAQ